MPPGKGATRYLGAQMATSGAGGAYEIRDISEGTYDVMVHHATGLLVQRGAVVGASDLALDLALARGLRLRGEVTVEAAAPRRGPG